MPAASNDAFPPLEFDPVIKLLHWLTAFLVLMVFVLAFSTDHVPSGAKPFVLQLHRSIGVTIGMITLGRLVWRQFTRFPNWPATMSRPVRFATNASEYLLYVLLLLQPILGLIQTSAHGDAVNFFFFGTLPAVTRVDRLFAHEVHGWHEMAGYTLLALIGLHAAIGVYHHVWRRDNTLTAMLPHRSAVAPEREQRVAS